MFHGRDGDEPISLDLKPVLLTQLVHLLREYALEHAGIVCLPTLVASEAIWRASCGWCCPSTAVARSGCRCSTRARVRSAFKLKLFIETPGRSFAGVPPWDRALIERGLIWLQRSIE